MRHYILCTSVTYAMKAQKELLRRGIQGDVVRTPSEIHKRECGYALIVSEAAVDQAITIIDQTNIKCKAVYAVLQDGTYKEVIAP